MLSFIGGFLALQVLYHLIVTFVAYGGERISPTMIALVRDGLRIFFCGLIFLFHWKFRGDYFKRWWKCWLAFGVLLLFGFLTSFFLFHKSPSDLLIGIKYGLWWMMILFSATGIGFFLAKKDKKLTPIFKWIQRSLVIILIWGRVWQGAKLIFPDFFASFGYGPLDDFHFGAKPPIYYLTGFQGTLRWQGLFAWPNNYGYFLVLFLPLFLLFFPLRKQETFALSLKKNWLSLLLISLWILTLGATLSRSALVGGGIALILSQFSFLKKHKKLAWGLGIFVVLAVLAFSVLKRESSLAHLAAKWRGVMQVIEHPLGYGLGSSGPAVHHSGNLLPENYYLQLMLDLGTVGFLLWCGVMFLLGLKQKKLQQSFTEARDAEVRKFFLALHTGFVAFLVMGLFLHVFEDSMVNYLFFVLYGMSLGYVSFIWL